MRCAWCRGLLDDVHGHMACLDNRCPMYGVNQAECCAGETAAEGWVATSDLASPSCVTDDAEPPPDEEERVDPDEGAEP